MIPSDILGHELISKGIIDLSANNISDEALLVSIAATKLRNLGLSVPKIPSSIVDPEISLYHSLSKTRNNGAHSAYNALIRRLVSFSRAFAIYQRTLA